MGRKLIRLARGELLWTVVGFLLIQLGLGFCVEKKLPQVRSGVRREARSSSGPAGGSAGPSPGGGVG